MVSIMQLPGQDSATGRGLKTTLQGFIGASFALIVGLYAATKTVPGCNEVIMKFFYDNLLIIAGGAGVSSGLVSFVWNLLRSDVKNY